MNRSIRLVFALLMSAMMVFMVTLVVTYLNLGWHPDFLGHWLKAYVIAWPIAAVTAWSVMPIVRRVAGRIVSRLDRAR